MLISGGNLIKKVLFPAEVLPIVTVLANMVHFFLGLPILGAFILYYRIPLSLAELAWFPLVVLVQLVLTLGFALLLSALTVHFRDLRDILSNLMTFWFFATPIIYPYTLMQPPQMRIPEPQPVHPSRHHLSGDSLSSPARWGMGWLLVLGAISIVFFLFGYFVFDRLRDTFAEEV